MKLRIYNFYYSMFCVSQSLSRYIPENKYIFDYISYYGVYYNIYIKEKEKFDYEEIPCQRRRW